ncbi:jg23789 [Pararge aegeria aegeria]|uniref:Jg23789 protein n=1 Tax=Pararge aegeria aegeria TaxID=348720 RepID=A0A8S4SJX4_9NEOP|nr:jg23789 [Pararge aegeria aegeria]
MCREAEVAMGGAHRLENRWTLESQAFEIVTSHTLVYAAFKDRRQIREMTSNESQRAEQDHESQKKTIF